MIRHANVSDAQAIIDIKKEIILSEHTTKFFVSSPKGIPHDAEKEEEKIKQNADKGNLYLVYEVDHLVVGFLVINRFVHNRLSHAGSMGMGINGEYTNQGMGTKMIKTSLIGQ